MVILGVCYSLCWIFSEFFEPKDLVLSIAENFLLFLGLLLNEY